MSVVMGTVCVFASPVFFPYRHERCFGQLFSEDSVSESSLNVDHDHKCKDFFECINIAQPETVLSWCMKINLKEIRIYEDHDNTHGIILWLHIYWHPDSKPHSRDYLGDSCCYSSTPHSHPPSSIFLQESWTSVQQRTQRSHTPHLLLSWVWTDVSQTWPSQTRPVWANILAFNWFVFPERGSNSSCFYQGRRVWGETKRRAAEWERCGL